MVLANTCNKLFRYIPSTEHQLNRSVLLPMHKLHCICHPNEKQTVEVNAEATVNPLFQVFFLFSIITKQKKKYWNFQCFSMLSAKSVSGPISFNCAHGKYGLRLIVLFSCSRTHNKLKQKWNKSWSCGECIIIMVFFFCQESRHHLIQLLSLFSSPI